MDFFKKNKMAVAAVVVVVVVAVVGFMILKKSANTTTTVTTNGTQQQNIKVLSPADIGLQLSLRSDKRAVEMTITKLTGVKTIEYEASYNAKVTDTSIDTGDGEEAGDVPRGVVASPISVNGQSQIHEEILLGTCSSGTCKYDDVTSAISFIVKVTYNDGTIGSVTTSLPYQ